MSTAAPAQTDRAAAAPVSPVLQLQDLSFAYPGAPEVLRHINVEIRPGERVGLIGPNGAGKSTLFLLSTGILAPTSGQIRLLGKTVQKGHFHPQLGLVFQNTDDQLFCPTVWEDIAFGLRNMGLDEAEVARRAEAALASVGAQKLAQRDIHHLSGGEKRLAAIAGILAMQPEMIIYDEPSTGLDMRTRRRLIPILQQSAPTLLIASHDLELLLEVCTRVLLLDEGRIVADGPPAEVMGNEALMQAHGQEKPHSLNAALHTHPRAAAIRGN
ncbi:MAG: ABC transporter ATP-binding protein [Brachymonas sp.]|nr:ABC transporter ATP-binding protein [Brachymonas sp.]